MQLHDQGHKLCYNIFHECNVKGRISRQKKDNSIYYRASITYRRKHISLGSFDTEDSANRAYEEADRLLRSETDTIDSYENTCALPF